MTTEPNQCGGCTMCCKVYRIPELDKSRGTWCPYCEIGKGCKSYNDRPETCSTFKCVWLQGRERDNAEDIAPAALRPDRSKVVVAADNAGSDFVATPDPAMQDAWRKPDVLVWLHKLAAASKLSGGQGVVCVDSYPYAYVIKADGSILRAKERSPVQEDGSRNIAELVRVDTV